MIWNNVIEERGFPGIPSEKETRFLTIQYLRDKRVNFSALGGVNFQLVKKGKYTELWLLRDKKFFLRPLFSQVFSNPLIEAPSLIMERIEKLRRRGETMREFGFQSPLSYRAFRLLLPLTNGQTGWMRLERTRVNDRQKALVQLHWGAVEDETWMAPDEERLSSPMFAVSFVRDILLRLVNAGRFLDRTMFFTNMSSFFQDAIMTWNLPESLKVSWTQKVSWAQQLFETTQPWS